MSVVIYEKLRTGTGGERQKIVRASIGFAWKKPILCRTYQWFFDQLKH